MKRQAGESAPNPLDVSLGALLRLRRKELGISQQQLAHDVGITFQQIQKYERGINRVSFSRLVEITMALKCSVVDIVGSLDRAESQSSPLQYMEFLAEPEAIELLNAFFSIKSKKKRLSILTLIKELSTETLLHKDKATGE